MAINRICSVPNIEWKKDKLERDYALVTIKNDEGKDSNKAIYGDLAELFVKAFNEKLFLTVTLDKKDEDKYWNVTDAVLVADQIKETPGAETPQTVASGVSTDDLPIGVGANRVIKPEPPRPSGQEVGLWWKELGEWLRYKEDEKGADSFWKSMRSAYFAQMFSVLDITIEKEE